MQIIAEVKTHSPFGWQSKHSWQELFEVANQIGDIVSIHTDPRWHGSLELVQKTRKQTSKPILAKGIHSSDRDITAALNAGANLVLVVGRIPKVYLQHCLIEPNTIEELANLSPELNAVWNSRDLSDGSKKSDGFSVARNAFRGWLCQASNIVHLNDMNSTADAVLIGTHLKSIAQQLKQY